MTTSHQSVLLCPRPPRVLVFQWSFHNRCWAHSNECQLRKLERLSALSVRQNLVIETQPLVAIVILRRSKLPAWQRGLHWLDGFEFLTPPLDSQTRLANRRSLLRVVHRHTYKACGANNSQRWVHVGRFGRNLKCLAELNVELDRNKTANDTTANVLAAKEVWPKDAACRKAVLVPWHNVEQKETSALCTDEKNTSTDRQGRHICRGLHPTSVLIMSSAEQKKNKSDVRISSCSTPGKRLQTKKLTNLSEKTAN